MDRIGPTERKNMRDTCKIIIIRMIRAIFIGHSCLCNMAPDLKNPRWSRIFGYTRRYEVSLHCLHIFIRPKSLFGNAHINISVIIYSAIAGLLVRDCNYFNIAVTIYISGRNIQASPKTFGINNIIQIESSAIRCPSLYMCIPRVSRTRNHFGLAIAVQIRSVNLHAPFEIFTVRHP
ncbi:MAG: hypothetical protein ACD_63C00046G0001 [uncultured bacterium]|nr:MAG: hypothetical protein ACD_63C00046G0001 [uncultured bacterium]